MANNIKSLLSKKGWTGEEVGKALIASLLNDIRYQGQEHEQLFTQADFDKMESSLSTDRDYLAYGVYRDIYSSIIDTYNRGQGLYQQFYNGYYRYLMHLQGAMKADHALKEAENYPLIMTEEQYRKAEQDTLERKKDYGESFYSLVFSMLNYFLNALANGETDKVPADILKAIEATKKEPAKGHALYSSYNELMGEGYYTLPDGTRSDSMTLEEWQEALKKLYLSSHKLTINGRPTTAEETIQHYNGNRLLKGWELLFRGADAIKEAYRERTGKELPEAGEQEILDELELVLDGIGKVPYNPLRNSLYELYMEETPTEWHYYTEAPEGLTAYDLLDLIIDESGSYADLAEQKAKLKAFKTEYKDLYTALEAYIKENVPRAGELKPAQLYKDFIGWGELAEHKIGDFETLLAPDNAEILQLLEEQGLKFTDKKRAFLRGIAIIQKPREYQLTESGSYKETANPLDELDSIENIAEDNQKRIEIEELQHHLFIPALSYLYAYNALIELIGAVYDIDGIEVAKFDTSYFESKLEGFNNLLYSFYHSVYGDKEEKTKKRELIKEVFSPVYAEEYKPTTDAIETARAELMKLGISSTARKKLKDFDSLIADLANGEGAN